MVRGLKLYILHLDHTFQGMDLYICYWHMLLCDRNLHLLRILVYIQYMDRQNIPEDKHKNRLRSFLDK